jgi:hypothetical protein
VRGLRKEQRARSGTRTIVVVLEVVVEDSVVLDRVARIARRCSVSIEELRLEVTLPELAFR